MEQAIIKKRVIGVDISLEETTYAIVNAKGEILVKDSFPTENYPDANDYIGTLSERILMMIEENGGYESIRSVGVSCPSANFSTGCMENSPNMPWKGVIPIGPMMRDLEKLSPRTIAECCDKGDELAIEVFRRTGHMMGMAMANYASIVDPEAIILTGGISKAGKWLVDPAYESFEDHVFGNLRGKVKILISKLDNRERDVLGASALAWSVPEYSLFK